METGKTITLITNSPAHSVTPNLAEQVLSKIADERQLALGQVADAFDPRIQGIVNSWPTAVDASRAVAIGLPDPPPVKQIVEQYLETFGDRNHV